MHAQRVFLCELDVVYTNLSQISFGITMSSLNLISLLNSSSVYSKYMCFDKHLKTFSSNVGRSSSRIPFSLRLTWPLIISPNCVLIIMVFSLYSVTSTYFYSNMIKTKPENESNNKQSFNRCMGVCLLSSSCSSTSNYLS